MHGSRVKNIPLFRGIRTIAISLYDFILFTVSITLLLTPISYIYLRMGPVTEKKRYNIHRALNWMARSVQDHHIMPGIRIRTSNPHEEKFEKPAVIICNHQSHLDLIPMLAFTPKVVLLTTDWVWKSPFYGYLIHEAEFLPASAGIDAIMPKLKSLVQRGYSIAIYPEGTRSADCSIGRFHQGAFYVAQQLGLDILPVVLYGTGKVLPKHGRYLRESPIQVEIDERISPDSLTTLGTTNREQASVMRKYYKSRYSEIADKIEQNA